MRTSEKPLTGKVSRLVTCGPGGPSAYKKSEWYRYA
jgi:hypothetical protein